MTTTTQPTTAQPSSTATCGANYPCGCPFADGRPEHVPRSIDESPRRLGTDHVDLYQLHRVDPTVPVEETWDALAETVAAGMARHIGLSEATWNRSSGLKPCIR